MGNVFPEVDKGVIKTISERYELTGGEISNIKSKFIMRRLLEPGITLDSCLEELVEKEFVLRKRKTRNPIGFVR